VRRRAHAFLLSLVLASAAMAADDPVIAHVGTESLSAHDVERRLAALPRFQLTALGGTPGEIRRQFVDTVLVPELLYANEAARLKLSADPAVARRLHAAYRRALVDDLEKSASSQVRDEDVRSYFDAHADDYRKPERIRIWRILVDDESVARKILADAQGAGGPARWDHAAREHSLDQATSMRNGLLGFVYPDGRTDVPQVAADPALYAAASRVKDGELVADPVKEGTHWAAVWRRGTLPAREEKLDDVRPSIRQLLARKAAATSLGALRDDLRRRELKEEHADAVEDFKLAEALPLPSAAPSVAPATSAPRSPEPVAGDRGLR
jgi:peptidyl-prolyl cis-trans isomerase C